MFLYNRVNYQKQEKFSSVLFLWVVKKVTLTQKKNLKIYFALKYKMIIIIENIYNLYSQRFKYEKKN